MDEKPEPTYTAEDDIEIAWERMEVARSKAIHAAGLCHKSRWHCPICDPGRPHT